MMKLVVRGLRELCVKAHRVCMGSAPRRRSYRPGGPSGPSEGGPSEGGRGHGVTAEHVAGEHSWICGSSAAVLSAVHGDVQVLQNFISEEEEVALLKELDPGLKRKRYEFDHWDDVSNS